MWCVCSNRDGYLSLMTRDERELMLSVLMDLKVPIPTYVVKVFEEKEDAEKYIRDINNTNDIIDGLFNY